MRSRLIILMLSLLSLLLISLAALGKAGQAEAQGQRGAEGQRRPRRAPAPPSTEKFDPHDFSGIWMRRGGDRSIGPEKTIPPLTAAGKEAASKMLSPGRSRLPGIMKNVADAADSNDPAFYCNPEGFPRILLDTANDYHEWHMLPDRMLQVIQWGRVLREIWMDGRAVPTKEVIDKLGLTWYGYSVGRWGGNTLVVTTVGMDDRALLDSFLLPKSANAKIEERYTRVDADTLQAKLTLTDPDYYTTSWVSDVKTWKKEKPEKITFFGWYGMFSGAGEAICAPMNAGGANAHGG
jgi:hypothetical protein